VLLHQMQQGVDAALALGRAEDESNARLRAADGGRIGYNS